MSIKPDFSDIIATHTDILALRDHVFNVYQPNDFSCSWESYSIYTTTDENLIDAAIRAISDDEFPEYLELAPKMCVAIATQHAKTQDQIDKFETYLSDVLRCLFRCHLNEDNNLETEEDLETV